MLKKKVPFKKHHLKPPPPDPYTPKPDLPERTALKNRGYFPGASYTMAELELIKAVDRYKARTGDKFPSAVAIMRLLLGLGYRWEFTIREVPTPPTKPKRKAKPITGATLFDAHDRRKK